MQNNIDTFPHSTFNWISLDGSQVLCHMPPSETYTAEAHFGDVRRSVCQHKSLDQDNTSLLVFGKGDGGGGPTMEHLEKLRRCRGISDTVGLLPRVHLGNSVDEFFSNLETKELAGDKFVTWYGELYLEFHRGTYTTQSKNKKGNRRSEVLMKDLEMLAAYASVQTDYVYPKQEIDDMWEDICLMQFHDCLPGSCIEMVYQDTDRMYSALFKQGARIIDEASEALGYFSKPGADTVPKIINTHPWPRSEVVKVPKVAISNGEFYQQSTDGGDDTYILARAVPGTGAGDIISPTEATFTCAAARQETNGLFILENGTIKATIEGGSIISLIFLPQNREVIPKGQKANQLVIYDDKPNYWQAWDVEVYHFE